MTWGSNPSYRWLTCPRCGAAVLDDTGDPRDNAHDRRCRSLRLRLKRSWARLWRSERLSARMRRRAERHLRRAGDPEATSIASGTTELIDGACPPPAGLPDRRMRDRGNLRDRE